MSNTRRPATARKQTKRNQTETEEALEQGIVVKLDGEEYVVRLDDVTSSLTRELRAKSGMSFARVMDCVTTDPDSDVIASFIWMARRLKGEDVELDDVTVTYRQLLSEGFDISLPDGTEIPADGDGADDPEA